MRLCSVALVGGIISLMMITAGEARRRPTIDSPGVCFNAPDTDYDCDGTICSCCYDEGPDAGCWICDAGPGTCVWDPKARAGRAPSTGDTLTISPETPGKGKLPKLPKFNAPLSEPQIAPQ
jgi:hypothetical protein